MEKHIDQPDGILRAGGTSKKLWWPEDFGKGSGILPQKKNQGGSIPQILILSNIKTLSSKT